MSCSMLSTIDWRIATTRQDGSSEVVYKLKLDPVEGSRFTGNVMEPRSGTIRGVCREDGPRTLIRFVINLTDAPRDSILLAGAVRAKLDDGVGLQFGGTYTNLLDPGDTGSGGGGQTPD